MEERAARFFNSLLDFLVENYNFERILAEQSINEFRNWYRRHSREVSEFEGIEVSFTNGMTKMVIVAPEIGYVLKIPAKTRNRNYCDLEASYYEEARLLGIEQCFAKSIFINYYGDNKVPLYLMQYVESVDDVDLEAEFRDILDSYGESLYDADTDCIDEVLERAWGGKVYDAFCDFVKEFRINDIHGANIGLAPWGLVVIDYSGY